MKQILRTSFNVAFASVVHLLCCWLPIIAAMSGRISIQWLLEFKNPLIVIQLGLLTWGFYDMYWRKAHSHSRLQKASLWVAAILTIGLNLMPHRYFQPEKSQLAASQFELIKSTRVADFELEKSFSEQKLNELLVKTEGIVPSQIKIESKHLSLRFRTNQTNEKTIMALLIQNGFEVKLLRM